MNPDKFKQLLASVRQMGRIRRGENMEGVKTSYRIKPASPQEVKNVRTKVLCLTQVSFANVVGESPSAIRHWEQGLRRPSGSATKIIRMLKNHPELVSELQS